MVITTTMLLSYDRAALALEKWCSLPTQEAGGGEERMEPEGDFCGRTSALRSMVGCQEEGHVAYRKYKYY